MMLDDRGVHALGKVSEQRKLAELARADVLCAPSLHGESFGMVLTEAFAAATPVLASDIPGYRDVVRDGLDGLLVPPGDALALAESLRRLALDPPRRARMAAARASAPSASPGRGSPPRWSTPTKRPARIGSPAPRLGRVAVRHGFAPADLLPPVPAQRLARTWKPLQRLSLRIAACARCVAWLCSWARSAVSPSRCSRSLRIGVDRVAASLLASRPGLVAAGLGLMCASMFARAIAWHAILTAAPTWRRAKRRDAMQGTFIGVLMSSTLPARLGEPSRALIVAPGDSGRARETLPVVLGTMKVSQTAAQHSSALRFLGPITCDVLDVDPA